MGRACTCSAPSTSQAKISRRILKSIIASASVADPVLDERSPPPGSIALAAAKNVRFARRKAQAPPGAGLALICRKLRRDAQVGKELRGSAIGGDQLHQGELGAVGVQAARAVTVTTALGHARNACMPGAV